MSKPNKRTAELLDWAIDDTERTLNYIKEASFSKKKRVTQEAIAWAFHSLADVLKHLSSIEKDYDE